MHGRFTSRRSRMTLTGAAVLSLGLSVAGMATAFEDDPAPAPAPVPVQSPSAEDVARAQVERQLARWAIANGYTGLSPVSLRPIDVPSDPAPYRHGPIAV